MDSEVIKSFLVGLGFDVDESSLAQFNKAIANAAIKVTALYAAVQVAAAGIFKGIAGISEGFEDMGYQLRLVAPAINKMLILRQAMLQAYSATGINLVKVVKESILFNYSLAKTKFALEAIYKSVGAKFLPMLTKQMDIFRLKIFQNMPKIQAQLTKLVEFIFKAFTATLELGSRLWSILSRIWDFFVKLDKATDGWSTTIIAVVAAWRLLNLAFLATPLGMLLTGLLAILALYDDFKTFQEGGKSLFDWTKFIPVINAFANELVAVKNVFLSVLNIVKDVVYAISSLLTLNFSGAKNNLINFFQDVATSMGKTIELWKSFASSISAITGFVTAIAGYAINKINPSGASMAQPVGPPNIAQPQPLLPQGSGVNQKVSQETNITVQGSADANATGKAVASQQDKVNFDMTRNLVGATR